MRESGPLFAQAEETRWAAGAKPRAMRLGNKGRGRFSRRAANPFPRYHFRQLSVYLPRRERKCTVGTLWKYILRVPLEHYENNTPAVCARTYNAAVRSRYEVPKECSLRRAILKSRRIK